MADSAASTPNSSSPTPECTTVMRSAGTPTATSSSRVDSLTATTSLDRYSRARTRRSKASPAAATGVGK